MQPTNSNPLPTDPQSSVLSENAQSLNTVPTSPTNPPNKNNNKIIVLIISIVVALLLACGAYFYVSFRNESDKEELSYEALENNDNPQDYKDFLEQFPQSKHASDVEARLRELEGMIQAWKSIALSDNVQDFQNFKKTYPNERYGHLCDIKIDSLDFVTAQRLGTNDAFLRYLELHPDGRYVSEASIAQGNIKSQEVSADEYAMVMNVLSDFFVGFSEQDESKICQDISATMTNFLHQKNATKVTVMETIRKMFNEHIQSCEFVVNRDIQIVRKPSSDGNASYVATFTVDQHIERDNEGKTFGQYECKAEVTDQMLITSLTMNEISRQ